MSRHRSWVIGKHNPSGGYENTVTVTTEWDIGWVDLLSITALGRGELLPCFLFHQRFYVCSIAFGFSSQYQIVCFSFDRSTQWLPVPIPRPFFMTDHAVLTIPSSPVKFKPSLPKPTTLSRRPYQQRRGIPKPPYCKPTSTVAQGLDRLMSRTAPPDSFRPSPSGKGDAGLRIILPSASPLVELHVGI